jgi:small subunit ribosomal protein S12
MPTFTQLAKAKHSSTRSTKKHYRMTKHPRKCPQKQGVCVRVYITKPKKPNSAQRKLAKVAIGRTLADKKVLVSIPGQGHNLQKFSVVMVRGGRVRDLPGVHYRLMRGKCDFDAKENFLRRTRRSFYGHKKPKEEFSRNQIIPVK